MHKTKRFTSVSAPKNPLYRRYLDHLAVILDRLWAYEQDVDDWYLRGEGRAPKYVEEFDDHTQSVRVVNVGGKGYRYPVCIHGRDLWVDHDIPCGICEDGMPDPRVEALARARDDWHEYGKRLSVLQATSEAARKAGTYGVSVPMSVIAPMADWVAEPIATNPEPTAHMRQLVTRRLP